MFQLIKKGVRGVVRRMGYEISRPVNESSNVMEFAPDFDEQTRELYSFVKPYTMTTKERVFALARSVEYLVKHDIPGEIVECGVWRGGSMMAVAKSLMGLGVSDRRLFLFDTFDGMPEPAEIDKDHWGVSAAEALNTDKSQQRADGVWAYSKLDEVKQNMQLTGYSTEKIVYVKGKVEDTIPGIAPQSIALLRLDTDWYESTYHELEHLYPRLSVGGVLIIDDYGHWEGARKAVDRYVAERNLKVFLNRIDDTGRLCIKLQA